MLCSMYSLEYVEHTYAPTANFKCSCDSSGADTKRVLRAHEVAGIGEHCWNGYMVYKYLKENMPAPAPPNKGAGILHIGHRKQFYVGDYSQMLLYNVDMTDTDVLVLQDYIFYEVHDCVPLCGIRSVYQVRSCPQAEGEYKVWSRDYHCHCAPCMSRDWDNCVHKEHTGIHWVMHNMAYKV